MRNVQYCTDGNSFDQTKESRNGPLGSFSYTLPSKQTLNGFYTYINHWWTICSNSLVQCTPESESWLICLDKTLL